MRTFARFTGNQVKARGWTWVRVDHAGKDPAKGMRGGSAKGDDPDIVWRVIRGAQGVTLAAEKRRIAWVPPRVAFDLLGDPLRFLRVDETWPEGTFEVAALLDGLGVPLNLGRDKARQRLAEHGQKVRNETLSAALRYRRWLAEREPPNLSPSRGDRSPTEPLPESPGQVDQNPVADAVGTDAGTGGDRWSGTLGDRSVPLYGDSPAPSSPDTALEEPLREESSS